ncbi:SDR family NAD(P)-dependent oxidoreductase [Streptomyces sp. VRA16 Mangrove soil]|uniref:SDR family NAD(P)-dependent oxidoreductase n=1 Tax=Streptomyces sp. VRA16 Mangrove soil TaxID=2817434 RepID=UPI001A9CE5DD|nr:SDR family NAD(P)-dependent oxidoreductase [Streptomyces sp. VRA16 Mangrove soil]MBO1330839.1 SDR family NAD(P)-dependent oxidoreductase [Streptomyces sp. VRA16 Mangrove soil]
MSTILITGATSGLGRHLAFALARDGHTVLAHGRDKARTESLVRELRAVGGRAEGFVADLASLEQVRDLGARVAGEQPGLDVLINNAGVGAGPRGGGRELSADGHELRLAVNLLAPVALTRVLLPALRSNAPARVVHCGSLGQSPLDFDDLDFTRGYNGTDAYCRSKFALAAHTFSLARELAGTGVTVNVIHPATYMDTAMVREAGISPWSTVEDGAAGVLALAVGEAGARHNGAFFDGTRPARAHEGTYDRAVQQRLDAALDQLL